MTPWSHSRSKTTNFSGFRFFDVNIFYFCLFNIVVKWTSSNTTDSESLVKTSLWEKSTLESCWEASIEFRSVRWWHEFPLLSWSKLVIYFLDKLKEVRNLRKTSRFHHFSWNQQMFFAWKMNEKIVRIVGNKFDLINRLIITALIWIHVILIFFQYCISL